MKYNSDSIGNVVDRLNRQYFLPAIQREFVWKPIQVIELFDSLLRGYPIGSFLFWQLDEASRGKWQVYEFLRSVKEGGTHNESASLNGVNEPVLILDGQQRLTSLLVGLRGEYTIKQKHARRANPDAFRKCSLYLDLLHDPSTQEDESDDAASGVYYRLAFRPKTEEFTSERAWYPVGRILQFRDQVAFADHKEELLDKHMPEDCAKRSLRIVEKNLNRLYDVVCREDSIAYYVEREQDYDRVLDIFVRANEGGTKLSKSDLLLSMVTAKWRKLDAREEVHAFVDRLNDSLGAQNRFSKDFVLKCALVLSDLPVGFKAENFTDSNLAKMESQWPSIRGSIERGVRLMNTFGIDAETMSSANALVPLIYFGHRHPEQDFSHGTSVYERKNAELMRKWLIAGMLNRLFSGSSDNLLADIREVLRTTPLSQDFPTDQISLKARKSGPRNPVAFDETSALELVQGTGYGDPLAKLVLSLTLGDASWRDRMNHVDHIFPRDLVTKSAMRDAGVPEARVGELHSWRNILANLQLLTPKENQEKSNKSFEKWIKTRGSDFFDTHLIPRDPDLWRLRNFEAFLEAREKLLVERLVSLFKAD